MLQAPPLPNPCVRQHFSFLKPSGPLVLDLSEESAVEREDELQAALKASRAAATPEQIQDADVGSGGASGSGHQAYALPPAAGLPAADAAAAFEARRMRAGMRVSFVYAGGTRQGSVHGPAAMR